MDIETTATIAIGILFLDVLIITTTISITEFLLSFLAQALLPYIKLLVNGDRWVAARRFDFSCGHHM